MRIAPPKPGFTSMRLLGLLLFGSSLISSALADLTPNWYPSTTDAGYWVWDAYGDHVSVPVGTQTHLSAGHYSIVVRADYWLSPSSGWENELTGFGFEVNDAGSVTSSDSLTTEPAYNNSNDAWVGAYNADIHEPTHWSAYFNGDFLEDLNTITRGTIVPKPGRPQGKTVINDRPLHPTGKPCDACSSGQCGGGGTSSGNHSIDYAIDLGRNALSDTSQSNRLTLYFKTPIAAMATPQFLRTNFTNLLGNETIFAADLSPRQVVGPQTFADIVTLSAYKYQVSLYPASAKGTKDAGTGLYTPTGTPFKTITVENPDASPTVFNRLHIVESTTAGSTAGQQDYLYTYTDHDPQGNPADQWDLSSQGGLRHEILVSTPTTATDRVETRTISDGVGRVASAVRRWYHTYSWGEEIVAECVDPDGAALTTTYDYWHVDVPDPNNPPPDPYASWANHLKTKVDPNGHWERYEYDNLDRLTKTTTQFLDAPSTASDNQCRVTTTSYNDNSPLTETTVQTLQGVEVSRRYKRYLGQGKVQEIVCQHPGAAIDAADNLVTTTVTDINGNVLSTVQPDGTLSTYSMSATDTTRTELSATGAPNADGTAVADGTLTATTVDAGGHQLMQTVQDIASGLLLSSATTSQTDSQGRPTKVDYADGSSELTNYDCCGVSSRTDRDGVTTTYAYDALRRLESESRAGVTTHYTYDAAGRRLSTAREGSDGTRITTEQLAYDVAGRQTSRTDALSRTTTFAESIDAATGHTVRTTTLPDDAQSTRVETSSQDGSALSVGGTGAHPLNYAYGADATLGAWTQVTRVGSQGETTEWTKTYTDVAGRAYQTVTAAGATTQSFFNAQGQMNRSVDPDGVTTLYGYNARGEQDTMAIDMDQNGQIDFAGTDRITRTSRAVVQAHSATVVQTTTSAWTTNSTDTSVVIAIDEQNVNGRESWHTDAGGLVTHTLTSCDGAGTCTTTVTAPDGSYTIGVTVAGRPTSQTRYDANAQVLSGTTSDYDPQGRLWHQTDLRDGATTYVYDNADQLRSVSHGGQTTGYDYDALGRKKLQTEPDNGQIQTLYWPTGEVKSLNGVRTYPQEYTYDAQGRLKTLTTHGAAGAATTVWNYDPQSGQMIGKAYADGHGPSYNYTPGGRLHTRTWARGIVTTYGYDNAGQLQTVTYSDGTTPAGGYVYDRLGRLISASGGGSMRSLVYQGNTSLLASETATAGPLTGVAVGTGYDALLRRTSLTMTNNGTNLVTQGFGFDAASRLASASQGTASAAYTYWPNSSSNLVQNITFKNDSQPVMTTTKTYDTLGRLGSIVSTVNGATTPVAGYAYTYNAANERTRADVASDGTHWDYSYDGLGQVISASRQWSDNSLVGGQQFGYAFDGIGNRTSTNINGRPSAYVSNGLNEYSQRTVQGTVDVIGSAAPDTTVTLNGQSTLRQQGGYFYGTASVDNSQMAADAPVSVAAVRQGAEAGANNTMGVQQGAVFVPETPEVFSYDADGNLVQDGHWIYTWDGENRLVGLEALSSLPIAERKKLAFSYDDTRRRVQKQMWTWNAVTGTYQTCANTLFAHDGWNLVAEMDKANGCALLRSYAWGLDLSGSLRGAGGVGGLLVVTDQTASAGVTAGLQGHFTCFDGNGNVAALVKAQDGNTSASYEYGAFGEIIRMTGLMALANPMRFSSKYTDTESGSCYFGYRFYEAMIGRWLSKDPIKEQGGLNLYGYARNNPNTIIDLHGLGTWRFGVDNSGESSTPKGRPYVDVAYILDSSERKCCKSAHVDRYVKDIGKAGTWFGTEYANDNDDAVEGGASYPTSDPIRADADAPNGIGVSFLATSYTYRFKWMCYCDSGPNAGKFLSGAIRVYHTEGHIGGSYLGYFVSSPILW